MNIFGGIFKQLDFNLVPLRFELNLVVLLLFQFGGQLVASLPRPSLDFGIEDRLNQCAAIDLRIHAVSLNSSLPISIRRISLVPAPIS